MPKKFLTTIKAEGFELIGGGAFAEPVMAINVDSDQSHANSTYTIVSTFVFPGTDNCTAPDTFHAVLWLSDNTGGQTGDCRLKDETNGNAIAAILGFTSMSQTVESDSTLVNLPTGPAIFSIRTRWQTATTTVHFKGGCLV